MLPLRIAAAAVTVALAMRFIWAVVMAADKEA